MNTPITSDFEALKASWRLLINADDDMSQARALEFVREFGNMIAPEDISLARDEVLAEMIAMERLRGDEHTEVG